MKFSIIIPLSKINDYCREAVKHILKQDFQDFEVIVLPDQPSDEDFCAKVRLVPTFEKTRPADKRDLGAKQARGEILVFLDDDAYPKLDWLSKALKNFADPEVAAVGGPGVTPPNDNLWQKAAGAVLETPLAWGNTVLRNRPTGKKRTVNDYPTMNLFVRKEIFLKVGGFDTNFWPGEDTKFCLDLIKKTGKKIIYNPEVIVYHHRRALFIPQLRQIGCYAFHRGLFVKKYPETSRKLAYFVPSLFVLNLFLTPILIFILEIFYRGTYHISFLFLFFYIFSIVGYLLLLLCVFTQTLIRTRSMLISLLAIPGTFTTHVWYGVKFLEGLLTKKQ